MMAAQTPLLAWNAESGHDDFGPIDRAEFQAVLAGEGPCNRQCLAHRDAAHAMFRHPTFHPLPEGVRNL